MPKRKTTRLNPAVTHVVVNGDTVITPPFFHLDLARATLRELSKETENLSIKEIPTSESGQSFSDAVAVISQESRWLDLARSKDRNAFSELCEGWLTGSRAHVSEPLRDVAQ